MTNAEAISVLLKFYSVDTLSEETHQALECAIDALDKADGIKIEVIHKMAKPEEVNNIDFPNSSSENK